MRRIVVYEHLSGGGLDPADTAPGHGADLLAQGIAMRDAIAADLAGALRAAGGGWALSVAVDPRWPATVLAARSPAGVDPGLRPVHARPGEPALAFLHRLAADHDAVWVIAPESDGLLAACHAAVAAAGPGRWIGCDAAAIATASSKAATLRALAAAGVPTPLALRAAATRWVVKPDDGVGSADTWRFDDRAAAAAWAERQGSASATPCVLEPWVEGEPGSLTVLAGADGEARLLSVNRQTVETVADPARPGVAALCYRGVRGGVCPVDGARAAPLRALAGSVLHAVPGLRGLVGIDWVAHPRLGPVVIEVNPRVTSAVVGLAARLGESPAAAVLREFGHV